MAIQPPTPAAPPSAPLPALPPLPAVTPAAPGAATAPGVTSVGLQYPVTGIPRTGDEVRAIKARRTELSNQLESASSRRSSIAQRLRSNQNGPADGADRAGLEIRLTQLDQRILQLESDIALTGQQLAASPRLAGGDGSSQAPRGSRSDFRDAVGMSLSFIVLVPLAIALFRMMWRRGGRQAPTRENPESAQRLARLENAIDSIAIEMERVSEGQRFVTRLLSESQVMPRFDHARETAPAIPATRD